MRRIACLWTAAAVGLAVLPAPALADILKVGYVDTQRVFEQYKAAQDAQKAFDRDVDSWNRDLSDKKNEIADLRKELENQSLVLSDAKRREKESQLTRKQSEYQSRVDQIWGPHGQATSRNEELVKTVIEKVKKVLDTLAQKEGFTLILDGASSRILYASKDYDLTQRVIDQLNQEATEGTSGTAPAGH